LPHVGAALSIVTRSRAGFTGRSPGSPVVPGAIPSGDQSTGSRRCGSSETGSSHAGGNIAQRTIAQRLASDGPGGRRQGIQGPTPRPWWRAHHRKPSGCWMSWRVSELTTCGLTTIWSAKTRSIPSSTCSSIAREEGHHRTWDRSTFTLPTSARDTKWASYCVQPVIQSFAVTPSPCGPPCSDDHRWTRLSDDQPGVAVRTKTGITRSVLAWYLA
jgi:hypothetical protein